VQNTLEQ
jgi:hypothetical protein